MLQQSGREILRMLFAMCAAAVFACQPVGWAAAPALVGEITVKGSAEVNGISATTGRNVFIGDRIVTEREASVSVTSRAGARMVVVGLSTVQIKDAADHLLAQLDRGGVAAVSPAQAPLIVEVKGMRIVPGKTGSVYAVFLEGSKLKVLSENGTVSVETSDRTVTVPEGKTMEATVGADPAPSGAGAPGSAGSHLTDILIASTVALAATTIALAVVDATKTCTVSPSGVGTCQVK
jgi:hypothetical protein